MGHPLLFGYKARRMKFHRRGLILMGAGALLGAAPARSGAFTPGDNLDAIMARGTIRIGAYRDFAPFSYEENGTLKGTDIEIAKLVGDGLKIKALPELRNAAEDVDSDLRGHVWRGPVEGTVVNVMLHMPIDKELAARNDMVVMGAPYAGEKTVLVWSKFKMGDIPDLAKFKDEKIAVNINSLGDNYLLSYAGGVLRSSIVHTQTLEEAVDRMVNEDVAGTMGSINEIEWVLRKYPDKRSRYIISKSPPPGLALGDWAYGIAVRVTYHDLFYAVQDIIETAMKDGRIQKIYESYGLTYSPPTVRD